MVAEVLAGVGLWNLKNIRIQTRIWIEKFWRRSASGVWKRDSGHLWGPPVLNMIAVSGSRSNRILQFRTGSDWILKNLTGSDMDIQSALITAVKCLIRVFFRTWAGLDQISEQVYRIRIGPDSSIQISDWIKIAKISDFSTLVATSALYSEIWGMTSQFLWVEPKRGVTSFKSNAICRPIAILQRSTDYYCCPGPRMV